MRVRVRVRVTQVRVGVAVRVRGSHALPVSPGFWRELMGKAR